MPHGSSCQWPTSARCLASASIVCALAAGLGCDGAGDAPAPIVTPREQSGPPLAVRMLEPAAGEVSMAGVAQSELASETRPVIAAPASHVLRWREDVVLAARLDLELPLPESLQAAGRLLVRAWLSVPDPSSREKSARELRVSRAVRHRIDAAPIVVEASEQASVVIAIEIPEELRGLGAWLNVVADSMPKAAVQRQEFGPLLVRPGDRLVFGYGVAEQGWLAGAPPVAFRVFAELAAHPEARAQAELRRQPIFEGRLDPAADPGARRYRDASLGLASFEGERVRFVFEQEVLPAAGDGLPGSFPVVANPMLLPAGPRDARSRSLVLISLDTLRAESVGAYGYARETTPALDRRVAAAGALVEQAIAPVPFTPPSHMSMLTGLAPCVHGVHDRHGVWSAERTTLAETLRAAGFRTAAFTEDAYLVAGSGFARGFDVYAEERDEESASPGFAAETFAAAERWLREDDPRPFLLFIHTYQVHEPYNPPADYAALFAADGLAPRVPKRHRQAQDDYDREIRYADDVVSGFLDSLDRLGLAESTLLVVTSDHGEGFGAHFWTGHGASLHDEALRVPLLLRAPGLIAPGTRVEATVALMDLVPTLLELLAVDARSALMGRSFASLLTGRAPAFAERPLAVSALSSAGVRSRRYKYLHRIGRDQDGSAAKSPREALYDLAADPDERTNLVASAPELLAEARAALADREAECADFLAASPAASGAARAEVGDPGWMIHRDDIDRKLRSLGYLE